MLLLTCFYLSCGLDVGSQLKIFIYRMFELPLKTGEYLLKIQEFLLDQHEELKVRFCLLLIQNTPSCVVGWIYRRFLYYKKRHVKE